MSVFLGTWPIKPGEPDSARVIRIASVDENIDISYTPYLEVSKPGYPQVLVSIEGTWEDATASAMQFPPGEAVTLIPAVDGSEVQYEAIVLFTKPGVHTRRGADAASTPWSFNIRRVA